MKELGMRLSVDDVKAMMTKAGCKITGRIYYEGKYRQAVADSKIIAVRCKQIQIFFVYF